MLSSTEKVMKELSLFAPLLRKNLAKVQSLPMQRGTNMQEMWCLQA